MFFVMFVLIREFALDDKSLVCFGFNVEKKKTDQLFGYSDESSFLAG